MEAGQSIAIREIILKPPRVSFKEFGFEPLIQNRLFPLDDDHLVLDKKLDRLRLERYRLVHTLDRHEADRAVHDILLHLVAKHGAFLLLLLDVQDLGQVVLALVVAEHDVHPVQALALVNRHWDPLAVLVFVEDEVVVEDVEILEGNGYYGGLLLVVVCLEADTFAFFVRVQLN